MDGNFSGTREMRIRAADTIIILDIRVGFARLTQADIALPQNVRPDMAEGR
jgi:hypothetical protein